MFYRLPQYRSGLLVLISFGIIATGILGGLTMATQYCAHQIRYSSALGRPLLGRIYSPLNIISWQVKFGRYASYQPIFRKSFGLLSLSILSGMGVAFAINFAWRLRHNETDVHGSAHWATSDEIVSAGLIGNKAGLYIGAYENKKTKRVEYLRYKGEGHVLCFAPTRSGKGVGLVIPNLLTVKHSVLALDIRQELWNLTSNFRRQHLSNVTIKFDPTCTDQSGASFNPLYEVRLGTNEVRDVQNIAEMIVDYDGKGKYDHWRLSAYNFLTGCILHVLYAERNKTLSGVANLLSDPDTTIEKTLERMLATEHDSNGQRNWVNPINQVPVKTHPVVSNVAREMLNKSPEERSGIISTTLSFLALYRDPVIASNTSHSDFRIKDLSDSARPVSLYLVIPPADITRTKPLLRLILHLVMSRLVEEVKLKDDAEKPTPQNELLLMLDEFASLGKMEFIQESIAYMAAYGLKAFLILQDLGQLHAHYGKEESISGNCHVRIAYAPNKVETAKDFSQMTGTRTVMKVSRNLGGRRMEFVRPHISESIQESQRPLLMLDEAMRLPPDDSVIFVSNMAPIYGKKIKYYKDRDFACRVTPSRPEKSDKILFDPTELGFPIFKEAKEISSTANDEDDTIQLFEALDEIPKNKQRQRRKRNKQMSINVDDADGFGEDKLIL